ncbi:transglutaminase domain-containing protein [Hymenobacter glacieicola]|uniref:transglutaminase domain-containing protein n=1 Tax=Hymenobacter glacieicola TaxID=1562124 RepID=UPI00166308AF|nr:transglutaminase domain-containing protein [Hymenobacter glacieicola]
MITRVAPASWRGALAGLVLCFPVLAWAQEVPVRFGKLDAQEAAQLLARPAPDSAAAEVICDFGQSTIKGGQDGFELRFERTARLLIRRRPGYEHATVRVVLYHDPKNGSREQIQQLKGITYNLTGKELSKDLLRTEAVFSRKLNDRLDEYAFTLPNVREGSILEFTYAIRSPFLFNLQDWQFQQAIPVRWSEYRVQIPSFYRYKEMTRSYWPFAVNTSGAAQYTTTYREKTQDSYGATNASSTDKAYQISTQALTRRWVQQDIPAFRPEPFLTTEHDYLSRVDFELERIQFDPNRDPQFVVSSWAQIEKELLEKEEFGQYLQQNSPLASAAAALRSIPDPAARAAAARQLVLQAVGYSGSASLYARATPKRVLETRQGNAAEINLLLVRLLREAGLEAQPLLLSTRNHGRIQTELPVLSQFNYVAAHVRLPGNQELVLDATDPTLPPELLPENCLNDQGRLLGSAGRWVALAPSAPNLRYTHARLTLEATGTLQGTVRQEYAGYAASEHRQPVAALRQQWQQAHPDWQIEKAEVVATDLTRPVALTLAARLPGAEATAATLYVRPTAQLGLPANPFRHPDRLYPVDMASPQRLEYMVELTLPEGYAATELPAAATLALPNEGGRFVFSVSQPTAQTLAITSRLHLAKTHYSAEEYQALRELYARALAKMAEPIVVQRQ